MTPLVFLVCFCLAIVTIAIGQVVGGTSANPTDGGSTVIVLGITLLAAVWVTLEESILTGSGQLVIGGIGSVLVVVGLALVIRRWDEPTRA